MAISLGSGIPGAAGVTAYTRPITPVPGANIPLMGVQSRDPRQVAARRLANDDAVRRYGEAQAPASAADSDLVINAGTRRVTDLRAQIEDAQASADASRWAIDGRTAATDRPAQGTLSLRGDGRSAGGYAAGSGISRTEAWDQRCGREE